MVDHAEVSPTSLPTPAAFLAPAPRSGAHVALVGPAPDEVCRRLSSGWTVTDADDPALDLAVYVGSDPAAVAGLCAGHTGLAVLAVIPRAAGADLAVSMLGAGADGCLRGLDPVEVTAHLRAMTRRCARRVTSAA